MPVSKLGADAFNICPLSFLKEGISSMKWKPKICKTCQVEYTPTGSLQQFCLPCGVLNTRQTKVTYRLNHKGDVSETRDQRRSREFRQCGLDDLQVEKLLSLGCPSCEEAFRLSPHIDHDHRICDKSGRHACTKCFRGLICDVCNTGFIRAIEHRPALRNLVSQKVIAYIDKLMI